MTVSPNKILTRTAFYLGLCCYTSHKKDPLKSESIRTTLTYSLGIYTRCTFFLYTTGVYSWTMPLIYLFRVTRVFLLISSGDLVKNSQLQPRARGVHSVLFSNMCVQKITLYGVSFLAKARSARCRDMGSEFQ